MSALAIVLSRIFWAVDLASFASAGAPHTHVAVDGYVAYARLEADGDLHIRLVPTPGAQGSFVIAECVPAQPCARPAVGAHVRVRGVSRKDSEHGWFEVHPVERIDALP